MASNDLNSTLGFWDTPGYSVKQIADIYFQAIGDCASSENDIYVSIKPPALHFDLQIARDLSQFAMQKQVRLHCDSHGVDVADDALGFAEVMLKSIDSKLLGITIPCRWQRSVRDIEFAIEHQLNVRLVKGQWPDRSGQDRDMKTGFMESVDQLSGRARHVAVASHDVNLALDAVNQLCESETSCEFELLYGLPMKELVTSARVQKMKPRIYVPFGRGYVPHALRVFRTNPQLALWLGKDRLSRLIG
jgi:proline dehydrogenase